MSDLGTGYVQPKVTRISYSELILAIVIGQVNHST